MEQKIQLIVEVWKQAHMAERDAHLQAKLTSMLTMLEQGLHRPT